MMHCDTPGKENNKHALNSPSKLSSPSKHLTNAPKPALNFKIDHSPKRARTPNKSNPLLSKNTLTPQAALQSPNSRILREHKKETSVALSPLAWSPSVAHSPHRHASNLTNSPFWSPGRCAVIDARDRLRPSLTLRTNSPSAIALSSAPLSFCSEIAYDEHGFMMGLSDDPDSPSKTVPSTPSRSADEAYWQRLVAQWDGPLDARATDRLVSKGIHPSCRAAVWKKLADVDGVRAAYNAEGIYYGYLRNCGPNAHTPQIKLDLHRTFPTHKLFQEKKSIDVLYNILASYSHLNSTVGYCQGMAYIAGVLMMFLEEEDAFWTFVCVMKKIDKYYGKSMEGILTDSNLLTSCMKIQMLDLYTHLRDHKIDTLLFSSKWLLSLFTDFSNWNSVLRFWDIFFVQGRKGLLRISLGILAHCEEELLRKNGIEEILPFICSPPGHVLQPQSLFAKIGQIDVDELFETIKTANTPQPSRVVSFFNSMVEMVTPRTVDKTQQRRVHRSYETPCKNTPMATPRSVRQSSVVLQNVTAFEAFATPKYLREKILDENEEMTPQKRFLPDNERLDQDPSFPVKRLKF